MMNTLIITSTKASAWRLMRISTLLLVTLTPLSLMAGTLDGAVSATGGSVSIGNGAAADGGSAVAIGENSFVSAGFATAVGATSNANSIQSTAIGASALADQPQATALGSFAQAVGEFSKIGRAHV